MSSGHGALIYTGRNEAAGSCGGNIGLVNPISGTVDPLDMTYTVAVDFTCYGDADPTFSGVPVTLSPLTQDIIVEQIAGYPEPIYLHRKGCSY